MPSAEQAYLFRHALMRDAAYALHLPGERAGLHRLAIDSFVAALAEHANTHAEALADHAMLALAEDAGARDKLLHTELHYLRIAADQAAAAWRVEAETRLLQRLLKHPLATPAERATRALRLVQHLMEAGEYPAARKLALEHASGDDDDALAAALLEYRVRVHTGAAGQEKSEIDGLVARIEKHGRPQTLAPALLERAKHLERNGRGAEAVAECSCALEVAHGARDVSLQTECLLALSLTRHTAQRAPQAESDALAALALARETGNRNHELAAHHNLGIIYSDRSRLRESARHYEHALTIARDLGASMVQATISNHLANLHFYFFGYIRTAERQYLATREFFRERGDVHSLAHANGVLGLMYLSMGENAKARECFQQVLQLATLAGERVMRAKALRALAVTNTADDMPQALSAYETAIKAVLETMGPGQCVDPLMRLSRLLLDAGLIIAAREATQLAYSLPGGNNSWQLDVASFTLNLLTGNDLPAPTRGSDPAPHHRLTDALYPKLCLAARRGDTASARETLEEMQVLAATFQADGYVRVRTSLANGRAAVRALESGAPLWNGVPPMALTPPLRRALVESHRGTLDAALQAAMLECASEPWRRWDTPLADLMDLSGLH